MSGGSIQAGKAHILLQIRDQTSQGLKVMEKKFRDFGTSVSLTGGVAFAASAGVMSWPLKLAGDMEQTTTSFKVFLGDAEKAKKFVQTLDDISLTTPYEMSTLAEASRMLMASGLQDSQIPDMLSMIGDVAQGDAEAMYLLSKAFADVQQNGKLMAQENNQFRNSGFNVLGVMAEQMAAKMGGTKEDYLPGLRDQMEEGVISVHDVAEAFRIATSEGGRFHGMQIEQANTFKGLLSTLWDYVNRGLRNFGNAMLPTAKMFIRFGMNIADFVGRMITRFNEFFTIVGNGLMAFVATTAVVSFVGASFLALSFVVGVLASVIGVVLSKAFLIFLAVAAGVSIAVLGILWIFETFKAEIYGVASFLYMAWQPAIESVWNMYETFKTALWGITDALTQGNFQQAWDIFLLGLEAGFYEVLNLLQFVGSRLVDVLSAVFPMFSLILDYAAEMLSGVYDAILAGRLDLAWAIVWNKIAQVWQWGITTIMTAWAVLVGLFRMSMAGLKFMFLSVANGMGLAFDVAFMGIRIAAAGVVKAIETALNAIGQGQLVAGLYESIKPNETLNDILERRAKIQEGLVNDVRKEANSAQLGVVMDTVKANQELHNLQQEGIRLEEEAAKAREDSGVDSFAERAAKARAELAQAVKDAQRPEVDPQNTKNPIKKAQNLINQDDLMGKYMKSNARGTFSAIAATYLGKEASDYEKQTAKNTKDTADAVKNLGLTFGQ